MGLIKSPDIPLSVSAFSMHDIEAAAKSVLMKARLQAEKIVNEARTESEQIKSQAQKAGHSEGFSQGRAEGLETGKKNGHAEALAANKAAMTQLINSLTETIRQIDDGRDQLQTNAINEVVALACSIARKVTKRQANLDERIMCENLREALSLAVHAADVRIAVHPSQFKTLQAELPNLRIAWPQLKHIEVVEDGAIGQGGARVFTQHGKIDGDLDAQLDHVIADLLPAAAGAEAK
jgi:flagellar assembly protein FliH